MEELQAAALLIIIDEMESDDDVSLLFSDTSSPSSEDDEEVLLFGGASGASTSEGPRRPRVKSYLENVVAKFNSEDFKSHFRLSPDTFEVVLSLVGPIITYTPAPDGHGHPTIEAKKQLLLSLWIMATPDSLRSVCDRFDVGKATCLRSLRRVTRALHSLAPHYIKWPEGPQAEEVKNAFERNSGFPRVIGAIDGTHVPIRAPDDDAKSYINRKGSHSIQVQAVCTHNLMFTSVYAGHAGCVHDARVFRNSPVSNYVEHPEQYFPSDCHLVGDGAYGIHPQIMTPFRDNGHLSVRQKNFNFCLSSARIAIERAFGLWKCRWRRMLDCLPLKRMDKIPEFILATCVLHNMCILNGDRIPYEATLRARNRAPLVSGSTERGATKRMNIMNSLPMRYN